MRKKYVFAMHRLLAVGSIVASFTVVSGTIGGNALAAGNDPVAGGSVDQLLQRGGQQVQGNQPEQALRTFESAIAKASKKEEKLKIASALHNIGVAFGVRGDLAHSKQALTQSLKLCREIGDSSGVARAHGALGIVYRRLGDHPRAIENYRAALSLLEKAGDKESMAVTTTNLGLLYVSANDIPRAEEMFLRALKYSKQTGSKMGSALAHGNLGSLYRQQGSVAKACSHWISARNLWLELRFQQNAQSAEASMAREKCVEN